MVRMGAGWKGKKTRRESVSCHNGRMEGAAEAREGGKMEDG